MAERSPARELRVRPLLVPTLLVAVLFVVAPGSGTAQEDCEWLPPTSNLTTQTIGATTILRVTDPHLRCADGIRLRADSARHFENQDFYQLFGDALFEDNERRVEGDLIRYWRRDGRVDVRGNGRIERMEDGSVVTGDEIDLLQAGPNRARDQLTVTGSRPRAIFHPGARTGQAVDTTEAPWDVTGDRLFFYGQETLTASGDVEIRRDSLEAYAEAAEFDELGDRLALRRNARMITDAYELEGDSIIGLVIDGEVRELRSLGDALLLGEDLRLAAPRITIDTPRGLVERLVAVRDPVPIFGPAAEAAAPQRPGGVRGGSAGDTVSIFDQEHPERPVARAEGFLMVADSIDVQAPDEVLQRLVAVGTARAESTSRDSLNNASTPAVARRDWISGDTIVATFSEVDDGQGARRRADRGPDVRPDEDADEATPPGIPDVESVEAPEARPDSARDEYRLDELLARVNARSLYRMAPADSTEARDPATGEVRLAVHYVTGNQIRIRFQEGEIELMEVAGPTEGIHIEPTGGRAPPVDTTAADTTAAPAGSGESGDTSAAPPDTSGIARPATAEAKPSPSLPLAPEPRSRPRAERAAEHRIPRRSSPTGGTP